MCFVFKHNSKSLLPNCRRLSHYHATIRSLQKHSRSSSFIPFLLEFFHRNCNCSSTTISSCSRIITSTSSYFHSFCNKILIINLCNLTYCQTDLITIDGLLLWLFFFEAASQELYFQQYFSQKEGL